MGVGGAGSRLLPPVAVPGAFEDPADTFEYPSFGIPHVSLIRCYLIRRSTLVPVRGWRPCIRGWRPRSFCAVHMFLLESRNFLATSAPALLAPWIRTFHCNASA